VADTLPDDGVVLVAVPELVSSSVFTPLNSQTCRPIVEALELLAETDVPSPLAATL
jgi:hypothetical protein